MTLLARPAVPAFVFRACPLALCRPMINPRRAALAIPAHSRPFPLRASAARAAPAAQARLMSEAARAASPSGSASSILGHGLSVPCLEPPAPSRSRELCFITTQPPQAMPAHAAPPVVNLSAAAVVVCRHTIARPAALAPHKTSRRPRLHGLPSTSAPLGSLSLLSPPPAPLLAAAVTDAESRKPRLFPEAALHPRSCPLPATSIPSTLPALSLLAPTTRHPVAML